MPIFNTRNPIEYPLGLVEALASMASGAVGQLAGVPAGLLKAVTSGQYGTQEGVQTAQEEANRVQQAMTYRPRTETAVQGMGLLGKAVDAAKIPPIMPELQPLGAMAMQPKQAYVAQGMNLEKALEPVANSIMQKGGLPASLLEGLASGTQSNMISPAEAMRSIQGTKILDESGMPQMVYRGAQGKYDPLTHNMSEASKSADTGMWFSGSAPVASTYSGRLGHVSPAYLDMKNPLVVDAEGGMWHDIPTKQLETLMNVHVPKATVSSDFIARLAKSRGYDGVHFKNMIDSKIDEFDDPRSIKPSDVFVNFNPKNVYSALSDERLLSKGNVADVQKLAPVSPTGFYSAVEQAAMNLKREKGPGQGLLNEIIKSPDVKKEELHAMGLLDRFGNSKPTTKQELLDYIGKNKVEFGETRLGGNLEGLSDEQLINTYKQIRGYEPKDSYGDMMSREEMLSELSGADVADVTKYSDYTFPGGKNYREILLTMPDNQMKKYAYDAFNPKTQESKQFASRAEAQAYANQDPLGNTVVSEVNVGRPEYRSGHWDEPNVLAHIRAADHTDADGKNMMLVEEIQSDWHQAGRDKGYDTPSARAAMQKQLDDITSERQMLLNEQSRLEALAKPYSDQNIDAPREIFEPWSDISYKLKKLQEKQNELGRNWTTSLVPDAPMKDTWYQMALKKAIKDAVDNGYDRVGLPTGAAQAERYDLSKQVDGIFYTKNNDGTFNVSVAKGDKEVWADTAAKPDKLSEVVGKDIAKKIVDGEGANEGGVNALRGLDLKVGGEGMKKYYDEVYPKFLDKFAKKYGSSVKETQLNVRGEKWPFSIRIESDGKQYWLGGKDPRKDGAESILSKKFDSIDEAYKQRDKLYEGFTEPVRYIDITPEMKKEFGGKKKGFPLFSMAAPVGAGGLLDQFDQQA